MDDSRWERLSALCGVVFAVLMAASAVVPGSPAKPSDTVPELEDFVADKGRELRVAAFLSGLAILALFWFAGALWRFLRRAEGGVPRLTVVATLGISFAAVMTIVGNVIGAVMGRIGVVNLGNQLRTLYLLWFDLAGAAAFGITAFLLAFSIVVIRSGAIPKVMGWIGIMLAVVFVGVGGIVASTRDVFFYLQYGGFIALTIWFIVMSVMVFRVVPDDAPAVAAA